MRPEIEPTSSWILVEFVTSEPQWELWYRLNLTVILFILKDYINIMSIILKLYDQDFYSFTLLFYSYGLIDIFLNILFYLFVVVVVVVIVAISWAAPSAYRGSQARG